MSQRSIWYHLSDDQLLSQCDIDTYRASGPGGQKRNKTSSAVRLRHEASGLIVIAEESRSQHANKAKALQRMRLAFMLKLRESISTDELNEAGRRPEIAALRGKDGKFHVVSAKDSRYWPAVAVVLDVLEALSAQVSEAARFLETTTGNLLSLLEHSPKAWEQTNIARQKFGHKPLRTEG